MARRRKRKLNVKVAILLAVVVAMVPAGLLAKSWYMRHRQSTHPQVFQKALDQAKAGDREAAYKNFDRAISFSSVLKQYDDSVKYRMAEIEFLSDWYRADKTLSEDKRLAILENVRIRAREAAKMKDDDVAVLRRHVQAYWDAMEVLGGAENMIKAAETYLKKQPNDAEVRRWVAQGHALLAPGKKEHLPLAVAAFEEAVKVDPNDVDTFVDWAALLEQQQRPTQEVMDVIRRGAAANPNSARLLALLSRLMLMQQHDKAAAEQYFARALEVPNKGMEDWVAVGHYYLLRVADPKSPDASALLKDADPNMAVQAFMQAAQGNPENAAVYLQLDELHRRAGRLAPAEEILRTGLQAFETRRGDLTVGQLPPRERRTYTAGTVQIRAALAKLILLRKSEYGEQWPAKLQEAREHVTYVTQTLEQARGNPFLGYKLQGHLALVEADNNEKLAKAESFFRKAYDQLAAEQQVDPEVVFYLIDIYRQRNQYGEARTLIDKMLGVYPDSIQYLMAAARMDLYFGNAERAEAYVRKLAQMQGGMTDEQRFELARMQRQVSKAPDTEVQAAVLPERITEAMIPTLIGEARMFHSRRQNEQAVAICQAILKQYPKHEETRLLRVAIYLVEQDREGARKCLEEGLAANPQAKGLLYQKDLLETKTPEEVRLKRLEYIQQTFEGAERERRLSEYYEQNADPNDPAASVTKALDHLEKAVELDPNNLQLTRKLFYSHLLRKDYPKAEAVMEKAKAFGPDEADLMRASVLKEKARSNPNDPQFKEAVVIMKDALARHETFSEGHALLGEMYLDSGNLDDARAQLNRSYELNPSLAAALVNLARLANMEGRPDDHEKWINLAYRYSPNNAYVRNHWLLYQEKHATTNEQFAALITYCEQWAGHDTQDVENWVRLARLYMKVDPPRKEPAGQIYRELYRNFSGNKDRSLQFLELYLAYLRMTEQADEGTKLLEQVADKETDKVGYFVVYGNHLAVTGKAEDALTSYNAAIRAGEKDRRPYIAKSIIQIDRKDWSGAVVTLRDAGRNLPDDRELKIMLINVLLQAEQFDAARQVAADMVAANSKDLGARVLEGRALQLAGRLDDARAKYDAVIAANAASTEALRYRAMTSIASGGFADCIKDLRSLDRLRPDPATIAEIARIQMMTKDLDGAKATLEEGLKVHDDSPRLMQALINVLMFQGNQDGALAELRKAQEKFPMAPALRMQEAGLWARSKDADAPARRVTALRKAWELTKGDPGVLSELLDALLDAGRNDELKQIVRSENEKNPEPAVGVMLQVALGRANLATGNEAEAVNCFRTAYLACKGEEIGATETRIRKAVGDQRLTQMLRQLLAQQDNWAMRLSLARILRDQADTKTQAAELLTTADLSQASSIARMLVYQDLGYILQDLKRYDEALKTYQAALALTGINAPGLRATTLNNLAYLLAEDMKQSKEAIGYARQAMQLMPQATDIMDTLAWAYYRDGQLNMAEHHLVQAIELEPSAPYRYHLGMVQEAKGNKDEALRQYRLGFETVRDNPNDEQHRKIKERLAALGAQ